MSAQLWTSVCDAGPPLNRHWVLWIGHPRRCVAPLPEKRKRLGQGISMYLAWTKNEDSGLHVGYFRMVRGRFLTSEDQGMTYLIKD